MNKKVILCVLGIVSCMAAVLLIFLKDSKKNYEDYTESDTVITDRVSGFDVKYEGSDELKDVAMKLNEMGYTGSIMEVPATGADAISYFVGQPTSEKKYFIESPDGKLYEAGYTTEGFEVVEVPW